MREADTRNPILLLHGIDDTAAALNVLATFLAARGHVLERPTLAPCDGTCPLEELAVQVASHVGGAFPTDQPFDIVAFSLGGLVARYYLQRLGGLARVRRFVSISSPHHGTLTAHLRRNPGSNQLRPGSAFLRDLNADVHQLTALDCTTIWTPLDLMIIPAWSARLPTGRSRMFLVPRHPLMQRDARVCAAAADALENEGHFFT